MAVATKKSIPSPRAAAAHGDSWIEGVEEVGNLGNGYLIVKVDRKTEGNLRSVTTQRAKASVQPTVGPRSGQISHTVVKQLLENFGEVDQWDVPLARAPAQQATNKSGINTSSLMGKLRVQEAANRQRDIDSGVLLTSSALASRLGISTQSLSKAVQSKRMFTLDGPSGRSVYPEFFADARCQRAHLERVSQALGDLPGPSKWEFFTSPRVSLHGHTPIDALANGELDLVLRAAAAFKGR